MHTEFGRTLFGEQNIQESNHLADSFLTSSNYSGLQKFRLSSGLFCFLLSLPPDCHNREDDKVVDLPRGEDDEVEEDRVSEDSISSHRSSLGDADGDAEFEQKINRLIAAKQKLRQLQNLAAMVQVFHKYKSVHKNVAFFILCSAYNL